MVLLAAYLPASGLAILHCTALALTNTNHSYMSSKGSRNKPTATNSSNIKEKLIEENVDLNVKVPFQ